MLCKKGLSIATSRNLPVRVPWLPYVLVTVQRNFTEPKNRKDIGSYTYISLNLLSSCIFWLTTLAPPEFDCRQEAKTSPFPPSLTPLFPDRHFMRTVTKAVLCEVTRSGRKVVHLSSCNSGCSLLAKFIYATYVANSQSSPLPFNPFEPEVNFNCFYKFASYLLESTLLYQHKNQPVTAIC